MSSPNCAHCGTVLRLPLSLAVLTVRCVRCGAVHHRDGEVISPRMLPAYASYQMRPTTPIGRASPWIDGVYRPVLVGMYDTRYRDGTELVLHWNGAHFTTFDGQRVSDRTLQCWRGSWQ